MKRTIALVLVLAALAAGGALGWWLGRGGGTTPAPAAATTQAQPANAGKILYYRNPMGLPDTSPVPKKDPMGMDYVPVYAGAAPERPGTVVIAPEKIQRLGVKIARAERRALASEVRASGVIAIDETRRHAVAPRFEGWVERLYANQVGMAVQRGAPLADVYSPELVSAQNEYLIAKAGLRALGTAGSEDARLGMQGLVDAALARLRNWGIGRAQLARLEAGEVRRLLTLAAPVDGVLLDKRVIEGARFMPGETILELADLSQVWLLVDVPATASGGIEVGQAAKFSAPALPGRTFDGAIAFVHPTIDAAARTLRVRVVLDNRDGALRPNLYGDAVLAGKPSEAVVAVPRSALLDSGRRQVVLVDRGEGRFEPREVVAGRRDEGYVEVEGIAEGEAVVVSANFLIDAESNLRAALGALGTHGAHGDAAPREERDPALRPGSPPAPEPAPPRRDHEG